MWNAKANANAIFRESIKSVSGHSLLGLSNKLRLSCAGRNGFYAAPGVSEDDIGAVPPPSNSGCPINQTTKGLARQPWITL